MLGVGLNKDGKKYTDKLVLNSQSSVDAAAVLGSVLIVRMA